MLVPNRHSSSDSYRYGFQGQEKDDELKGEGNSLNYTFRMHDPRVGRFFATDPLESKYPYLTPYQFSSNQPIHANELEGAESSNELGHNYASDDTELMFNMMFGVIGDTRAAVLNLTSKIIGSEDRFVGDGYFGYNKLPKGQSNSTIAGDIFDVTIGVASARFGINGNTFFASTKGTGTTVIKTLKNEATQAFVKSTDGKFSKYSYRLNLQIFTKHFGKSTDDAHHMFPKAKEFSKFFDRMKVDVNDPRFMKWMDRATEHTPKFSSEYNKLWKQYIDAVQGKMVNEKHLLKKAKEFEKRAQKVSDEYYKKLKKG